MNLVLNRKKIFELWVQKLKFSLDSSLINLIKILICDIKNYIKLYLYFFFLFL